VASILETLRAPRQDGAFAPEDKLRLVLVFYISSPENVVSKDDIAELEKELKNAGVDTAAFEYVRRMRDISRMTVPMAVGGTSTPVLGSGQGELFRGFTALGNRVSDGSSGLFLRLALILSSTVNRSTERRWSRKSHLGREEFPSCEQAVPCDPSYGSTDGPFCSVQPVLGRNR